MNLKAILFGAIILVLGISLLIKKEQHFFFVNKKMSHKQKGEILILATSLLIVALVLLVSGFLWHKSTLIFPLGIGLWFVVSGFLVFRLNKGLRKHEQY